MVDQREIGPKLIPRSQRFGDRRRNPDNRAHLNAPASKERGRSRELGGIDEKAARNLPVQREPESLMASYRPRPCNWRTLRSGTAPSEGE